MDVITEKVIFKNSRNQAISGRIYHAVDMSIKGVIFCHGLFSTKDGYKITRLASDIVKSGHTLLTFDFSFVGESEGDMSELSIFQEVDDLKSAVNFFLDYGVDNFKLIGSSFGGSVSIIYSATTERMPAALLLIATPVDFKRLISDALGIKNPGSLPNDDMTSVDGILIRNKFFRELLEIDMSGIISRISVPAMIIHGEYDKVVNIDDARYLFDKLNSEKDLVIIEKGDHNLTDDSSMSIIKDNLIKWLNGENVNGILPEV